MSSTFSSRTPSPAGSRPPTDAAPTPGTEHATEHATGHAAERATLDAHTLARWGWMVDLHGIAAYEREVRIVASAARDAGLSPVLVEVLSDPREPSVARARSFGRLALALAA